MDKGRQYDLAVLREEAVSPRNALHARKIKEAAQKIVAEQRDPWKRRAREELIKYANKRDVESIKGASDEIIKHKDFGMTTFSFLNDEGCAVCGKICFGYVNRMCEECNLKYV